MNCTNVFSKFTTNLFVEGVYSTRLHALSCGYGFKGAGI